MLINFSPSKEIVEKIKLLCITATIVNHKKNILFISKSTKCGIVLQKSQK